MKHPDHREQTAGLKRIEGQVRGIRTMIDEQRYCIDILNQLKAVRAALATVETRILNRHLQHCLRQSLSDDRLIDEKIEELMKVLKR